MDASIDCNLTTSGTHEEVVTIKIANSLAKILNSLNDNSLYTDYASEFEDIDNQLKYLKTMHPIMIAYKNLYSSLYESKGSLSFDMAGNDIIKFAEFINSRLSSYKV